MDRAIRGALALKEPLTGSVVTLGSFDGVHRGHQVLIERAVTAARNQRIPSIAYTFHPHPAKTLAPNFAPPTLMSIEERVRVMRSHGLEIVLVEPFNATFSEQDADDFVRNYLARLAPRHVVVGFNFCYGKRKSGDPEHLRHWGQKLGFSVDTVDAISIQGEVVSSTRVRQALQNGELDLANALLGRPHAITGPVVQGDQRGRTIGFPTANVSPEAELLPKFGVYATRATIIDALGHPLRPGYDGVTNIGQRPTFDGARPSVESFLFNFEGDLYGQRLRVELIARIRDEQKFSGLQALVDQLHQDVATATDLLARSL